MLMVASRPGFEVGSSLFVIPGEKENEAADEV